MASDENCSSRELSLKRHHKEDQDEQSKFDETYQSHSYSLKHRDSTKNNVSSIEQQSIAYNGTL
jgi:hypothetical protein